MTQHPTELQKYLFPYIPYTAFEQGHNGYNEHSNWERGKNGEKQQTWVYSNAEILICKHCKSPSILEYTLFLLFEKISVVFCFQK